MIVDQHVHSLYSFDSQADLKSYADFDNRVLMTSEHVELCNSAHEGRDDIPDFAALHSQGQELAEELGIEFVMGMELGYAPDCLSRFLPLLDEFPNAVALLSIHQDEGTDFALLGNSTSRYDRHDFCARYFSRVQEAIGALGRHCRILSHLDYPFRYRHIDAAYVFDEFSEEIHAILDSCQALGLAVEINTKSMFKYHNLDFYELLLEALEEHHALPITLGSDCHYAKDWHSHWPEASALCATHGKTKYVRFHCDGSSQLQPVI
ncbi:PHP domain-containing protein [Bifidobacterium bombi]|uniref:Histidinol-phosphatase n=1 Tax=Bifidobacterium bombi DSM 19703 TaxID=1341695 RepID=A0A080N278_9BIFI|nr:PHP domain-containing protein [Bifidobacterium bombi]KFF31048.1 histidinol phosphate phosphatase HisJ family protein [Bifidobacterium bombi DSM 19703]